MALVRNRSTAHQIGLSQSKRRQNVAGAFSVAGDALSLVAGAAILLIDDVITTGATADAAAKALKQAGARRVDVLALARVGEPSHEVLQGYSKWIGCRPERVASQYKRDTLMPRDRIDRPRTAKRG